MSDETRLSTPITVLGCETDLVLETKFENGVIKLELSVLMPGMEWDAERGVMRVWPPPRRH